MYSKIALASSTRVFQRRVSSSSICIRDQNASIIAFRLLCQVEGERVVEIGAEEGVEAAADLAFGEALAGAACDVGARFGVVAHAVGGDRPEGAVALAVAAAVEPV